MFAVATTSQSILPFSVMGLVRIQGPPDAQNILLKTFPPRLVMRRVHEADFCWDFYHAVAAISNDACERPAIPPRFAHIFITISVDFDGDSERISFEQRTTASFVQQSISGKLIPDITDLKLLGLSFNFLPENLLVCSIYQPNTRRA